MIRERESSPVTSHASHATTDSVSSSASTPVTVTKRPMHPFSKDNTTTSEVINKIRPERPSSIKFKTIEEYQDEINTLKNKLKYLWEENQQKERECVEAESLVQSVLAQNISYLKGQIEFEKKFNDLKAEHELLKTQSKEQIAQINQLKTELSETMQLAENRRVILNADSISLSTARKVRRMYENRILDVLRQSREELEQLYELRPVGNQEKNKKPDNCPTSTQKNIPNIICLDDKDLYDSESSLPSVSNINNIQSQVNNDYDIDISEHDVDENKISIFNRSFASFNLLNCHFTSSLNGITMIDYKFEDSVIIKPGESVNIWNEAPSCTKHHTRSTKDFFIQSNPATFSNKSLSLYKTYQDFLDANGYCDTENVIVDSLRDENNNVCF
jgi:hypothetical protein